MSAKPYELRNGNCKELIKQMADNTIDAIVTDPPYELGFMGKKWDATGIAYDAELWAECLRVLKPGGHLLAFSGSRTYHRMAVAIEDAGFAIRDQIMWVYGSGFPKSHDVSKAIDKLDAKDEQKQRQYKFTAWVRSQNVTAKQIDEATGTFMGSHYTTDKAQPAVMTREHLEQCRHLFDEVPEWVEREADKRSVESKNFAEREILGNVENGGLGAGNFTAEKIGAGGYGFDTSYNITAPATDAAKEWNGWGTALKPAHEPICVARKPLIGTVAENVLEHGTGAFNIDGCRVGSDPVPLYVYSVIRDRERSSYDTGGSNRTGQFTTNGRWPANLIHDGSAEVLAGFPESVARPVKIGNIGKSGDGTKRGIFGMGSGVHSAYYDHATSAARFFYCAKASKRDRDEGVAGVAGVGALRDGGRESLPRQNHHPTVKPTDLMRYLCRLVTPPNGLILDPFTGSGSTGKAAILEGFRFVGFEMETQYIEIATARIEWALEQKTKQNAEQENTLFGASK